MDNEIQETPQIVSSDAGDIVQAPDNVGETQNVLPPVNDQTTVAEKTPPIWKKYPNRGYIIAIAVSILLLFTFNNLQYIYVPWIPSDFSKFFWNVLNNVYNHVEIPHLSKAYMQCLWAINIAITASILGNFLLLIFRPRWFHYLIQVIIYGLGILAVYVLYAIYPFSFESDTINLCIKAILIAVMAGLLIALVIAGLKSLNALIRDRRSRENIVEMEINLTNPHSLDNTPSQST
jgi:hypothetical protein